MVSLSSSFVLLALGLSALSAPVPNPQDPIGVSTVPAPIVSVAPAPVVPAAPAPVVPVAPSSPPVTFGDLTTPSTGGTFNDFKVGQVAPPSGQVPPAGTPVTRRLSSRLFHPNGKYFEIDSTHFKRLIPSIFRNHGDFDRFNAAVPPGHGKGGKGQQPPQGQTPPAGPVGPAQKQPGPVGPAQSPPSQAGPSQNQPNPVAPVQNQSGLTGPAPNQPGAAQNQPAQGGPGRAS